MTKNQIAALLRETMPVLLEAAYLGAKDADVTLKKVDAALAAMAAQTADGACLTCGEAITQPATGRPRMYCGEACKKRAYRSKRTQREG